VEREEEQAYSREFSPSGETTSRTDRLDIR